MTQRDPLQREEFLKSLTGFFRNLPRYNKDYWSDFQSVYMSSGLTRYIDDYKERIIVLTVESAVASFILSAAFLGFIMHWSILRMVLGAFATALIFSAITGALFVFYPYYRRHESKVRLEDGLIYFLSYMAILSASGMPIERILERLTEVEENPPLIHLTKKFMLNVRLFGMDIRTAIRDIGEMSPSKTLAKQFEGIRTAIATSGDLKALLVYEVERQLEVKRDMLKAKINTLVYIGELYVAMMVVTPILFIIIISVLSILGANALGGSSVTQLNLIVFVGIPILGGIFIVMLDQTLGREE
ncbi:MAG: type II secretion system F family protein [Candidatus Bathyarchaeota archaeon]|nr:type II secretion system F family protein [Candidatus Bathyarchaeota archaeon]